MTDDCLFCKMIAGTLATPRLHDDELVFAIRDISPRAPVHLLIIPKEHISDARHVTDTHGAVLTRMLAVARQLAVAEGIEKRGYRIAFNVGEDAGMTVHHLHMHVLGGRPLGAEG